MSTAMHTFIGVDIAQKHLDIAVEPTGQVWTESYDAEGLSRAIERIKQTTPDLVALEPTGNLEKPCMNAFLAADLPVILVNPQRIRNFARSIGQAAKTDRLDARIIARYAQAVRPPRRKLPDQDRQQLAELVVRRDQLSAMHAAETYRLSRVSPAMQREIQPHIAYLEACLDDLNRRIDQRIATHPIWAVHRNLLTSVPGVGPTVSAYLIACLPELGGCSHRQIAALVGVAPFAQDSGSRRAQRSIRGGRSRIRRALYMATLVALRYNQVLPRHYERLLAAGKRKKVALVACMRKLIVILNAMMKSLTPWRTQPTPQT